MQIYLVRHGQTNYNLAGLCNDDPSKDVHLTNKGITQALATYELLKETELDVIFTSEFTRTIQTANLINQNRHTPIHIDRRLNDRKTGFEGLPSKDYKKAIPPNKVNTKIGKGESFIEQKARIASFLQDLKNTNYRNVLIVGHSEPIKTIIGIIHKTPDEEILSDHLPNCKMIKINYT